MAFQRSTLFSLTVFCFGLMVASGCAKDKFTTRPQLEFKEVADYTVARGGLIKFTLQVTDKEGDLTDSIFIATKTTRCTASNRQLKYLMPPFPITANSKAEIEITFVNGQFVPGYVALPGPACGRPDTTTFYFWIRDKAKNVSDTVQTDKPIIILN